MLTIDPYERLHVLVQGLPAKPERMPTPAEVLDEVCHYFKITEERIKGNSRSDFMNWARQVACYLMRTMLDMRLSHIAKEVGRTSHATILRSVDQVAEVMKANDTRAAQVLVIKARIEMIWPSSVRMPPSPAVRPVRITPDPETLNEGIVYPASRAEDFIAFHEKRIEQMTKKFLPPTFQEAIEIGRAAAGEGCMSVFDAVTDSYRLHRLAVGTSRTLLASDCRSAIVFVLRELGHSFTEIAEVVGQPNHTSTLSSYRRAVRILAAA